MSFVFFWMFVKLQSGSEVYRMQVCLSLPFVFFWMLIKLNLGSELGYAVANV